MHLLYYYFCAPDSNSADDTYDPTRECFHIDGAIASDSEDEAAIGERNTPPQVELPAEWNEAQFLADQGIQLEQIHELQDRLDEEQENLCLLQQTLEQEHAARAHGRGARERARDVNRRIVEDREVEPPVFGRAAMLLRNMPEPSNPEARRARDEIRGLLETAAMQ
jgi:DNA-binding transcriptional MerR regulator